MKRYAIALIGFVLAVCGTIEALAADSSYRIGPGDTLEISVWKDAALSRTITVPPDGRISFPLIGDIPANDLTIPALRDIISKKLTFFVPDATVTAILMKPDSLTAYVIGKVNKPGPYPIGMESTVMQVLSMAGGLNPYAAAGSIIILRQEGGKTVTIPFDYDEVKKGVKLNQNIPLKRGDVVVVP
jgi:polysaccharide biosynthesis/export protein